MDSENRAAFAQFYSPLACLVKVILFWVEMYKMNLVYSIFIHICIILFVKIFLRRIIALALYAVFHFTQFHFSTLRYKIHYTPPIHIHFKTELTIAHMRRCKLKIKKFEIFVFIYSAEMLSYISKYLLVVFQQFFVLRFEKYYKFCENIN